MEKQTPHMKQQTHENRRSVKEKSLGMVNRKNVGVSVLSADYISFPLGSLGLLGYI